MFRSHTQGFTIIELLIVIVIIGILASISTAAYSGVRVRAEDSVIASKVSSIVKIIETYGAANGGLVPQADWACIGEPEDFPAGNGYDAGWCSQPSGTEPIPAGNTHGINPTLNAALKTLIGRVPNSNIPEVDEGGGWKDKGIWYDSSAGANNFKPVLEYAVKGMRSSCPFGEMYYNDTTYTWCIYRFKSVTSVTGT